MRELSIEVESAQLARSLSNVLAFVPARCVFPWVRVAMSPGELVVSGGDLYAFGVDRLETSEFDPTQGGLECILTRADAIELERSARSDKKGYGVLRSVGPGPSDDWFLQFLPNDTSLEQGNYIAHGLNDLESDSVIIDGEASPWRPSVYFDGIDGVLERLEDRDVSWPRARPLAFSPSILSRFAKVKRHDAQPTIMDCWISSTNAPILVKIGPFFTGCIQPVIREEYDKRNPQGEGLWDGGK